MLTHGSLFSGIDGLDMAVRQVFGAETVWFCEYEKACRQVLERHHPDTPIYEDVRELDDPPRVDILSGGYPCQPFSKAGSRKGAEDPRHLWPEFARLIRLLRPRYAVLENVAGHLSLGFDEVLCDLAEAGFDAEWIVIRASDAGAPHRRERLFCLAYSNGERRVERQPQVHAAVGGQPPFPQSAERDQQTSSDSDSIGGGQRTGLRGGGTGGGGWRHVNDHGSEAHANPYPEGLQGTEPTGGRHLLAGGGGQASANPYGASGEARNGRSGTGNAGRLQPVVGGGEVEWGAYEPAIRRWERITRRAPHPVDGNGRLAVEFTEWMMGLPAGWVEGLSRTHALKALGNSVVPQQARLALEVLCGSLN